MDSAAYYDRVESWFASRGWTPAAFQREAWGAFDAGVDGLIHAPTGSGKTYALLLPILHAVLQTPQEGIRAIWISPIRALSQEIAHAARRAIEALDLDVKVGIRTGDTSTAERKSQAKDPPHILITTPESLHIMLSQRDTADRLAGLQVVVADEWHELLGSKRGVLLELALSRLRSLSPSMLSWGISATVANLEEAARILVGYEALAPTIISASTQKTYEVITIMPDHIDQLPWAGHLGIRLLERILPIIEGHESTLVFTNTRSQCEIWYQRLLEVSPSLAGIMAMHHSAISDELRHWVEDQLHLGKLKVVVCTSSLDLGVDFGPVEAVVQIGSPKGVSRFMQRAGRSGHRPGLPSRIYFVPTHALELIEGAALRSAIEVGQVEQPVPYIRCFDLLTQYMMTLASGGGFDPDVLFHEISSTHAYASITREEYDWVVRFITQGSSALQAYDNYKKAGRDKAGYIRVRDRRTARMHRLSIGTIVGSEALRIRYANGRSLGTVEEYFISHLRQGQTFWFAGRALELMRIKGDDVIVQPSKKKTGRIPSWQGGRMPLSSELSTMLRHIMDRAGDSSERSPEVEALRPLLAVQERYSHLPRLDELLIESIDTNEGHHLMFYFFEGRIAHEGLAGLLAYRLGRMQPASFSIAMNDYGFELLSNVRVDIRDAVRQGLFSLEGLGADLEACLNRVEMARRGFRDIATIAGLLHQGYPGQRARRGRHLRSHAGALFDVFFEYEPDNLLLLQAYEEAARIQYEEQRIYKVLRSISDMDVVYTSPDRPTPFAFPIMVDRLREHLTSERLEDRIRQMTWQ